MRRIQIGLLVIAMSLATLGSHEVVYPVAQPISSGGVGTSVVDLPHVILGSLWDTPGALVLRTVAPNQVSGSGGFRNRNAADHLGIRLYLVEQETPIRRGEERWHGLFSDTLRVVLDLSEADENAYSSTGQPIPLTWPKDHIVPLTVECMILNASREAQAIEFLEVEVRGDSGFDAFSRVYEVGAGLPEDLRP